MNIKEYRTPQGMRTFARFYVVAIWPIMGPYFAWVKVQTGELGLYVCVHSAPQCAMQHARLRCSNAAAVGGVAICVQGSLFSNSALGKSPPAKVLFACA